MARVYSISTGERVHAWQPHEDYIRSITVHPTLPIILTASDDCTIKSWDWEKAWRCTQEYTGHNHYIMSLSIVCLLAIIVLAAGFETDELLFAIGRTLKILKSSPRPVSITPSRFGPLARLPQTLRSKMPIKRASTVSTTTMVGTNLT